MSKQAPIGHKPLVAQFLKHYEENMVMREGKSLTYARMQGMGLVKPFAVRLPVTMIAQLEALAFYGPWPSKQEMVYELIRASMEEIMLREDSVREQMVQAAEKAIQREWPPKSLGKVDAKKGAPKAKK